MVRMEGEVASVLKAFFELTATQQSDCVNELVNMFIGDIVQHRRAQQLVTEVMNATIGPRPRSPAEITF